MADVGADHEPAAVADLGDAAIVLGPGIHRHAFADLAVGADHQPRGAAAVFDRLRRGAERSEWIDHRARADRGVTGDMDMRQELATLTNFDMGTDDTIGTDRCILTDHRPRFDPGGWIDCHAHLTQPWRRLRPRRPSVQRPSPRRETTTCSFSGRSFSRGTRSCRPAPPACGTWPCQSS